MFNNKSWHQKVALTSFLNIALGGIFFQHQPLALGNPSVDYEIWGSDQSNSRSGVEAPGVSGSWIWIWDKSELENQLTTGQAAQPMGCDGLNQAGAGPCDLYDVFPSELKEIDAQGNETGVTLNELSGFGRLHGMLPDPQNRYMNLNIFAPGGGFVGIMDGQTKEAIALFRVAKTSAGRSVHMSYWNSDGSALLIANLHGKILERIDITRNNQGLITGATFNQSASLAVGKNFTISEAPKAYAGLNSQGNPLIGSVSGDYSAAALSDLTPNGFCKENGCNGPDDPKGGRANNVIICPISSSRNHVYTTFGGGGLLVVDSNQTPMRIVGEYGNQVINGAGCGGVQVGNRVWLNGGVSASGAGATQSTFTIYSLNDAAFNQTSKKENLPPPKLVFKDSTNTSTIGSKSGSSENSTGQLPGMTSRRDSHGMAATIGGKYVHTNDRIQNVVEVFESKSLKRSTYDLTSMNGKGQGQGACQAASVSGLPSNDPAPDLMEATPDGKYLVVALRGPVPVSVKHSAQGSCPGVGIIELTEDGASGKLVGVLRSTNVVDDVNVSDPAPGGHPYAGPERSDVHGAAVRKK